MTRKQYYSVLGQADSGKTEALINFVGCAVGNSLNLYLEACISRIKSLEHEEEWISLSDACIGTPYCQEYLILLACLGRIDPLERGRNW